MYLDLQAIVRSILATPKYCLPFLQPGRLIRVEIPKELNSSAESSSYAQNNYPKSEIWGAVVNFHKIKKTKDGYVDASSTKVSIDSDFLVDVLLRCSPSTSKSGSFALDNRGVWIWCLNSLTDFLFSNTGMVHASLSLLCIQDYVYQNLKIRRIPQRIRLLANCILTSRIGHQFQDITPNSGLHAARLVHLCNS